ncbi:MAG: diguanylate cyclase, partial [Gammaproteobacteria bacterium]
MISLFILNDELPALEARLWTLSGQERARANVELAWHLRQRDVVRASQLIYHSAILLDRMPLPERNLLHARCQLIESEAKWLHGELDDALDLVMQAIAEYKLHDDALGLADARWLRAWIELDCGNADLGERELAAAAIDARRVGDPVRIEVFDAVAALFAVFRDLHTTEMRWGGRFDPDDDTLHPVAQGWVLDFLGTSAFQASDFGRAVSLLMRAYEAALASGQTRRAINIATNIGNGFTSMNAHHAALEWMQRGLDLARPTGWPMSIGLCLMQSAETLRRLGQREAAEQLLHEALATLGALSGSRAYAIGLEYRGDLSLDSGDYEGALRSFALLEERGEALGQADFLSGARRGQAHALSHLDRPREALEKADAALALAREQCDGYGQMAALRVLAEIHARHRLPMQQPTSAAGPALHYLQEVMAVAATIHGYTVPGELLDAVAREYASIGDYRNAYEAALRAGAARDKIHSQEATNRAVAMQVQYQTERARTEGEHHRQLAEAEARRAEVLQQNSATLEHLSAIGQEITTHLDAAAVFHALDRHVHGLLDATHFSIFLIEPDGSTLRCAFGREAGRMLPPLRFSLTDPNATSARCVRERREIFIDVDKNADTPSLIPGTLRTLSLLFAPLLIGDRVLGVMTVQSLSAQAYGERERLIFRTLCAYGAIALDNASAYRQVAATLRTLSQTKAELLEKNLELERAYRALEDLSLTDQLTGLRNRRYFLQHVEADVSLSLRSYESPVRGRELEHEHGRDLVFYMVDIDHFKEVNDQHGHAAGDAVLVQMQERLREVFRESDHLIRWGGEEFLVLGRATDRDDARVMAERIRAAVANRGFVLPDGTVLHKTCSIGFACFPFLPCQPRLLSWSEVVELADQALYLVKRSGRNGWAAIYSTPDTCTEDLFPRLIHQLAQTIEQGQARLVSNL